MGKKISEDVCRLVILNHKAGKTHEEISKIFDISQMSVSRIMKKYREMPENSGYKPRKTNCRKGTCYRMTETQIEDIKQCILDDATKYGFDGNFWTSPRVKELIFARTGITYNKSHVHALLIKWGFSWQKPLAEDYRKDEDAGKTWIKETLPELKKSK